MNNASFRNLSLILIVLLGGLFSCEKDIDVPFIYFNDPVNDTIIEQGDTIFFNIKVHSNTGINRFSLIRTKKGVDKTIFDHDYSDEDVTTHDVNYSEWLLPSSSDGTSIFTAYVEDSKGDFKRVSKTIHVIDSLGSTTSATLFNVFADSTFALDMVNDTLLKGGDIQAMDIMDETNTQGQWAESLGSGNGSLFSKNDTLDISTVRLSQLRFAFNRAANISNSTGTVEVGDTYIVSNNRLPHGYGIIEIREVNPTLTNNFDFIRFNYKR